MKQRIIRVMLPIVASICFLGSFSVSAAQTPAVSGGITVTGTGTASAPASLGWILASVTSDSTSMSMPTDSDASTVGTPSAGSTALEAFRSPLIDAGAAEESITFYENPYVQTGGMEMMPIAAYVQYRVDAPTIEKMNATLDAVVTTAQAEDLDINMMTVLYGSDDCDQLQQQAAGAAYADARAKADIRAQALGVTRGEVLSSRDVMGDNYMAIPRPNLCQLQDESQLFDLLVMAPMYDPNIVPVVRVSVSVEANFAILP